jgi:urease accessory protein
MLRTVCLTALLLAAAGPAMAYPGHGGSGFLHPFTGPDHLLAMIGVGLAAGGAQAGGYQSDMPACGQRLIDEEIAVS